MKAWLGHYAGNPSEWFVVFAKTKDEAVNFVDCEVDEPDYDSVRPLEGEGMVGFTVVRDKPDEVLFKVDEGGIVLHEDDERIEKESLVAQRNGGKEVSPTAAQLGVTDPRVYATYLPRCKRCRQKHVGPCSEVTP